MRIIKANEIGEHGKQRRHNILQRPAQGHTISHALARVADELVEERPIEHGALGFSAHPVHHGHGLHGVLASRDFARQHNAVRAVEHSIGHVADLRGRRLDQGKRRAEPERRQIGRYGVSGFYGKRWQNELGWKKRETLGIYMIRP